MTDTDLAAGTATKPPWWRLIVPTDLPFLYELVTIVDPRWWRFSRGGLEPQRVLATAQSIAAGVIVHDHDDRPIAAALLADAGASGTGSFEYFAMPDAYAQAIARDLAPELIGAAFDGAPIRRLYHERFEGDPMLLGAAEALFEVEVTYPAFAPIGGRFETRTISVLTSERFGEWRQQQRSAAQPEQQPEQEPAS
ncbi:MAG: hypothetical protein Q7V88_11310 [Actinomycetota bacterium]|nr:hypothetical protein [Actinomycetota bacterium]